MILVFLPLVGCVEGKAVVLDVNKNGLQIASLETTPGIDVIAYNPKLVHLYLASDILFCFLENYRVNSKKVRLENDKSKPIVRWGRKTKGS